MFLAILFGERESGLDSLFIFLLIALTPSGTKERSDDTMPSAHMGAYVHVLGNKGTAEFYVTIECDQTFTCLLGICIVE